MMNCPSIEIGRGCLRREDVAGTSKLLGAGRRKYFVESIDAVVGKCARGESARARDSWREDIDVQLDFRLAWGSFRVCARSGGLR